MKAATISFGQSMPEDKLRRAFEISTQVDLVISIGSTLEVEPAASVPLSAHQSGASYAIVNMGSTAHDRMADVRLEGDATELLPKAIEAGSS